MTDNKEVFENIYNNKLWNNGRKDIPLSDQVHHWKIQRRVQLF